MEEDRVIVEKDCNNWTKANHWPCSKGGERVCFMKRFCTVRHINLGRSLAMRQVVTFQGLLAITLSDIHCCDRQGDSVSSMVDSPRLVVYMGNNSAIL